MEFLTLGSTPCDEPCAQVGEIDYKNRARKDCAHWLKQLKKEFGEPPEGGRWGTCWFEHDFGNYVEVVLYFSNEVSAVFAYNVENNLPAHWEDR